MGKNRILVVEDESIIAMELEIRLGDSGYDVLDIVPTGERAIAQAKSLEPELILMDIHLEDDMDGISAAAEIQKFIDIPIIFLTAHTDVDTLERAKERAPFGYLVKPFQQKELDIAIQMALVKHSMERKLHESEERLRLVLEGGNDIIVVQNREGNISYVHGLSQYGYFDEAALGHTPELFLPEQSAKTWMARVKQVFETGEPINQESSIVWNGEELWFNTHMYPLRDATGKITGVATVARNVTDTKRLKGILPICAWCGNKIRGDSGEWERLDMYLATHTDATVSHGMCDECQEKFHL